MAAVLADAAAQPGAKRQKLTGGTPEAVAEARRRLAELLLRGGGVEKLAAIEELADDALAWSAAHGVVMYKVPAAKAQASVVPIALLPSPFDASLYAEAVAMAPLFHELMDRIACDVRWLQSALEETGSLDAVCGGLLAICGRVYGPGGRHHGSDLRLHIMRNDFMLDTSAASRGDFAMKQVELNMIAASFSTHAEDLTEVHRYLLSKYLCRVDPSLPPQLAALVLRDALPCSPNAAGIAAALAEAHAAYEARWPRDVAGDGAHPRVVLFVSDTAESNELDHRKLEAALFRGHGLQALRRSLTQLSAAGPRALLSPVGPGAAARALMVEGREVTVAYFRTGYWPGSYEPREGCWAAREAIEASEAVKCPSVPAQLAGMKKVQQLLADSATLRRFLPEPGKAGILERAFARMGDPSKQTAEAEAVVQAAMADPASWVLKPQVEGSGELFFDADVPRVLRSKTRAELAEFILMERLRPPVTQSVVYRAEEGQRAEVVVRRSVAELGIFGTLVAAGGHVLRNEAVGHLLRSKAQHTSQGGVFVGNAVVDSPLLLPPEAFWPALS